jgi:hypothetical protein
MNRISSAVDHMVSNKMNNMQYWGPHKILRFKEYILNHANTFETIKKEIEKFEVIYEYELEHEDDSDSDSEEY